MRVRLCMKCGQHVPELYFQERNRRGKTVVHTYCYICRMDAEAAKLEHAAKTLRAKAEAGRIRLASLRGEQSKICEGYHK